MNYAFFSKCFDFLNSKFLRVLDTHDVFTDRKQMLLSNGLPVEFFYTTMEQEKIALRRASVAVAIKDSEAEFFRRITTTPVTTIGHVDFNNSVSITNDPNKDHITIGYLASENSINKENIKRFLSSARHVLEKFPDRIRFVIAGLISKYAETLPEANLPNVEIIGKIDDVEQFYRDRCDIVASPFDFGTGLKIKTTEAISFGKPIIGTSHAFEGLDANHPMHNFASIEHMANGLVDIINDPNTFIDILAEASLQLKGDLESSYKNSVQWICDLSQFRRIFIVANCAFWLERNMYERRCAFLIRKLSQIAHVHAVFPFSTTEEMQSKLKEWQWGVSIYTNNQQIDVESFVLTHFEAIDPFISIIQTPIDYSEKFHRSKLYIDICGLTAEQWCTKINNIYSSNSELRIFSTCLGINAMIQDQFDIHTKTFYALPPVDFEVTSKVGASVAILCDDLSYWSGAIDNILNMLSTKINWNGDLVLVEKNECKGSMQKFGGRYYSATEVDKIESKLRVCIQLGSSNLLYEDYKLGLINQGVPILRLGNKLEAGEIYEISVTSFESLKRHIDLIFLSQTTFQPYIERSLHLARSIQSYQALDSICKDIDAEMQNSFDRYVQAKS